MPSADPLIFYTISDRYNTNTDGVETKTRDVHETVKLPSSFVGESNPTYKRAIANGSTATTSATGRLYSGGSLAPFTAQMKATNGSKAAIRGSESTGVPLVVNLGFWPAGVQTNVDNQARAQAYSRMRSGFNASTFLGEMAQTFAMIKSPAMGLRRGIDAYRRRADTLRNRYKKLGDYRRAVADLWLEYHFGWKPLISDVFNASEAYKRTAEKQTGTNFSGQASQTIRSSKRRTLAFAQVAEGTIVDEITSVYTCRYKGSVRYRGSSSAMEVHYGSTWPDFVPTAWELCPWSFLIDYFSNVGDLANSWATAQIVSTGWTCRTLHEKVNVSSQGISVRSLSSGYRLISSTVGACSYEGKYFHRSVPAGNSVPLPDLQFNTDLSLGQGLNIAALIAGQRFDRRYR